MNKHIWKLPFAAGTLMILTAAGLCIRNVYADSKAARYAGSVLTAMEKEISAEAPPASGTETAHPQEHDLFADYQQEAAASDLSLIHI